MEPHLPPQPSPDAPAPPPGPEVRASRTKILLLFVVGTLSLMVVFGFLASVIFRSKKATERTEAINNIKQLNLALIDFDADYGRFPDDTTIADVRSKTHTTLALGTTTSNDYFRQLIAASNKSERIFWAPIPATPRKPNEVLGSDALKKGECSFAYIPGLTSSDDPATPVVMTPMIRGSYQFDPNVFAEKAVILRIDGSAKPETIRSSDRKVVIGGGKTLFDPSLPHWHGRRPDLKWPE
ncbi:hypothetical protein [Luteolibacter soli]|uniref:DUF1559 domain-containing protein n=1 Tax=Luteolibacter soli TaxID=3135280 RepID=A0ABU9AVR2_9BACT